MYQDEDIDNHRYTFFLSGPDEDYVRFEATSVNKQWIVFDIKQMPIDYEPIVFGLTKGDRISLIVIVQEECEPKGFNDSTSQGKMEVGPTQQFECMFQFDVDRIVIRDQSQEEAKPIEDDCAFLNAKLAQSVLFQEDNVSCITITGIGLQNPVYT
jgi:hypothetical protein